MITQALERLGRHSLIYAAGPAVQKLIGFLLLPLITAYIGTRANYGAVEMAGVTIAVAGQVLGVNLLHGMTRFWGECADERERGALASTTLILLALTTGSALLGAWLLRAPLARLLFEGAGHEQLLVVTFAILFFQTIAQVGLRWLQILERSVAYGVVTTLKLLLEIGLKIWFLVGLSLAAMGVLLSVLGGEALAALGLSAVLVARCGLRFSWPAARRLLSYSAPLFLSGLCMFVLHQADRYFVQHWHGQGEVGLYGLGYKLGTIGNTVLLEAFGLIWFPFVFGLKDAGQQRELCRRVLTYFTLVATVAALALAVFSRELTALMVAEEFQECWRLMPPVLLGYVAWAVFQVAHTPLYLAQRTGLVAALVAGAAAANLALNALLVPQHGAMGAAWATLATFVLLAAAGWVVSERVWLAGFERRRVLLPPAAGTALYLLSLAAPAAPWPAAVALKAACVLALPALLLLPGYLEPVERRRLAEISRTLWRRVRRGAD